MKFYSNDCLNCKVAKQTLDNIGVEYELISDNVQIMNVARANKIMSMPFILNEDGKFLHSQELKDYLNILWVKHLENKGI